MAGWVYYSPKSGIVPAPKDEWPDKPKVSGDSAFINIKGITGLKMASYTCFQKGDKLALEVQSDANGIYSARVYSKQNGEWEEVVANSATSGAAISEYVIKDSDSQIAVVAELKVKDDSGKDTTDCTVFLIDVGTLKIHPSIYTIGGFLGLCFVGVIVWSICSARKKHKQ